MNNATPFSPTALVGTIALLSAYAVAAWSVAAGIAGNARRSRRLVNSSVYGLYGFAALITLSSVLLIYAFVTHDFTIKYVAAVSDTTMETWYKVTSFWGGLDGSLLFWVFVLSLFSTVAIVTNHRRHRDMIGYVVATIMVVQVFFLSLLIFTKNPFNTFLTTPPVEGQGLNPLLQNYWMVIHPPSLYTGFVAATIPFAFGIGALASGRLDDLWLGSVRVWMLICFGFLSLGLILGGRWAYEELGWGGYWAWDPVENAGFMPWFTATAFLHSAIIQEQRGMMKRWNMLLVIVTFFLTIFGTFMTRAGIVQSVHAFGEDNVLALQFVAFLVLILVVSIGLLVYRSNKLASRIEFESFISREFAFLVNNWILLACAFVVLFLTMLPTISEALDGSRMAVGVEYFNKTMTPLGLTLLFLAGAAPLLAWRKTTRERLYGQFLWPAVATAAVIVAMVVVFPETTHRSAIFSDVIQLPVTLINFGLVAFTIASIVQEYWRGVGVRRRQTGSDALTSLLGLVLSKRRKYGGYIVHLGIAVLFFGFAGKAYERMIDRTIEKPAMDLADKDRSNARFMFGEYEFEYDRLIESSDDHKNAVTAEVTVFHAGKKIDMAYPAKWDYHKGEGQATTEVAIIVRGGVLDVVRGDTVVARELGEVFGNDVYIVLTGYDVSSHLSNLRVYINPHILWVWVGFLILAFGTLICLIPQTVVDRLSRPRASRLGRAADLSVVVVVAIAAVLGIASQAHAAQPPAEHVQGGMGMGADGIGFAAMNRPGNATEERAMKELLCICGCARETVFECKCSTAAQLRRQVMDFLGKVDTQGKSVFNLTTQSGRDTAYEAVLDEFVKSYGGEQVLATPRTKFSWLLPSLAVLGGLGLLVVVGRRWVGHGSTGAASHAGAAATAVAEDEAYADKLDDELADTD
ncbi:MAG TPA: cytochrome c-type biogenesis CcmF C-terminal domain-containing protein [Kofleriaceae bacterium]|nr:cytochrome c-type biogenesis CcmF C-terminal domain-containing protein [Kofleriaceae bacterium]